MSIKTEKSLLLTVHVPEDGGELCYCSGDFYKACPLRVRNDLDCYKAVMRIIPVDQDTYSGYNKEMEELDKSLKRLNNSLKNLNIKI